MYVGLPSHQPICLPINIPLAPEAAAPAPLFITDPGGMLFERLLLLLLLLLLGFFVAVANEEEVDMMDERRRVR